MDAFYINDISLTRYNKKLLYSKHNYKLGMKNVKIAKLTNTKMPGVKCNPWKRL
jgi:hypothetical protein